MLNDPPPEKKPHPLERQEESASSSPPQTPVKRPHPLERRPTPPASQASAGQRDKQQGMLHIPSVKPTVTYTLLAINIAIFVLRALSLELDMQMVLWGANDSFSVLQKGEYYRLFTAMFLHMGVFNNLGDYVLGNSMHLILNMYALYAFGTWLERLFGHLRFAAVYILGGLTGSLASAVLGSGASVGASGAIFAIIGAEFIFLHKHSKLLGAAGRARRQNLLMLGLINLVFGLLTSVSNSAIRIDNWGHIGGLVGGLILTWYLSPLFLLKRHPEFPDDTHFVAVDVNPLNKRYGTLSIYSAALLGILIGAVLILR